MKIIAGKYKNRIIPSIKNADYRPSTTKFREAVFSTLSSGKFANQPAYHDAKVLDLFAGTGSLSFEALSRGAKNITLIDISKESLRLAKNFAVNLGEENNVEILSKDATDLPMAHAKYNLIFMDPPYHKGLAAKALYSLINNNWIENGAIIVIEIEKREQVDISENISLIKEKIYSNNKLLILRYE